MGGSALVVHLASRPMRRDPGRCPFASMT